MGNTEGCLSNEETTVHNRGAFLFYGIWRDNVTSDGKAGIERSHTVLQEGTDVPAAKHFVPAYAVIVIREQQI